MENTNRKEENRLDALHRLEVLDTFDEKIYDDIALLIASICNTPIAMVSLVDQDRQWFKAVYGTAMRGSARDISFCTHTIEQTGAFIIPDALEDPRFKDSPLVTGEAQIRFYAGAPLVTSGGHSVGALCVVDHKPRLITSEQINSLNVLARHVVTMFELRALQNLTNPAHTPRKAS